MSYLEADNPQRSKPKPCSGSRVVRRRKIIVRESLDRCQSAEGKSVRKRRVKKIIEMEERYTPGERPGPRSDPEGSHERSSEGKPAQRLPQRVKLSIRGASGSSGDPQAEFDGDYILETVYDDGRSRRWEHVFPAKDGLFRAVVTANRLSGGEIVFKAALEGKEQGPRWSARCPSISKFIRLKLRRAPSKKVRWPDAVELTLLEGQFAVGAFFGSTSP